MATRPDGEQIVKWLDRIERSRLSPKEYLAQHSVPFGVAQYYRYRDAYRRNGIEGLIDGRSRGNNRVIHAEAEGFVQGYVSAHRDVKRKDLQKALKERFDIDITVPGLTRCLQRLGIDLQPSARTREPKEVWIPCAGFELIVALAWHFEWPQFTAKIIENAVDRAGRSKAFCRENTADLRGRNRRGQFTASYNRRLKVRQERFQSIEQKRASKSLESMDVRKMSESVLRRRCLAILALPLVTDNGHIRSVNTAPGMALKTICGFHYRQATLTKFLAELKYLGVSEDLLRQQVAYWQAHWCSEGTVNHLPLLCYYVDGNTKALWSKKHVKKNKVTMLGRVMGCLEQVFIHDNSGRPVYFETYSGHAPMGEYTLSLFKKIENSLEGPGSKLPVQRAIVMDSASNSVQTLRAFAAQKKYHYITSLDDNQWHDRKIRQQGPERRYQYGSATLWDCEIELKDSKDKGYLFVTRAIKIRWDHGKETYLVTSLDKQVIGSSLVVKSYFDRWPYQELQFKVTKAVACLNRVAGYGKQKVQDKEVRKQLDILDTKIRKIRESLYEDQTLIDKEEARIIALVPKEQRLRARSQIVDGQRILSKRNSEEIKAIGRAISQHQKRIKAIRKENPDFKKLERTERDWMRLRGKETTYKVDVELDQIMTYFRLSLVNFYAYLAKLLRGSRLSLVNLLFTVLLLPGTREETEETKTIMLQRNENDRDTMERLAHAIEIINELRIQDDNGKRLIFGIT